MVSSATRQVCRLPPARFTAPPPSCQVPLCEAPFASAARSSSARCCRCAVVCCCAWQAKSFFRQAGRKRQREAPR